MTDQFIVEGPINSNFISQKISNLSLLSNESGAHSIFLGQVRADKIDNKIVKEIEYSAYPEMVNQEILSIKEKIFSEFDDIKAVEIYHSVGKVKVGEISLLVLILSGHRKQSFEACKNTIELIKEKLPVWKQEVFTDDSYIWTDQKS